MACMKFIDLYAWKCFNINCHSQPSVQKWLSYSLVS
jgi:hypothetical protein